MQLHKTWHTGRIGTSQVRHNRLTLLRQNYPLRFLAPAGIMLLVFFLLPTLVNFVLAFTNWSSFNPSISFNGFDNFAALFKNGMLLRDLRTTLVFAICEAFFQNVFGLALAVFLEEDTAQNKIARVLFFIPVLMSALAVGYVWQAILQPHGALNQLLGAISGHAISIAWLGSTTWTIVLVSAIQGWKWAGLAMIIYLAGLKTIDPEVLEAATVDGANSFQMFWKIKFPLLAPAVTFNAATALLGSMNGFDTIQAMTDGGPGGSTEIFNLFVWRTFGQGTYAQSTTMSLILFLVVMIMAVPVITYLRKREEKIL